MSILRTVLCHTGDDSEVIVVVVVVVVVIAGVYYVLSYVTLEMTVK